jgi:hypothetical protein
MSPSEWSDLSKALALQDYIRGRLATGAGAPTTAGGGIGKAPLSACQRDWVSLDCAGDFLNNIDISVTTMNPTTPWACLGVGQQGGTFYNQLGVGACSPSLNIGYAAREYKDRECDSVSGGGTVPVGPVGVGAYHTQGVRPGHVTPVGDSETGVSLGLPILAPSWNTMSTHDPTYCP